MTETPAPYGNPTVPDTRTPQGTPLSRFFEAAECRTQVELADFLGIRQSSISDAKRRNAIPAEWLVTLLRRTWVNPSWVLTGQEPRYLCPCENVDMLPTLAAHDSNAEPAPQSEAVPEHVVEMVRRALLQLQRGAYRKRAVHRVRRRAISRNV